MDYVKTDVRGRNLGSNCCLALRLRSYRDFFGTPLFRQFGPSRKECPRRMTLDQGQTECPSWRTNLFRRGAGELMVMPEHDQRDENTALIHNAAEHRFEIDKNGQLSVLEYIFKKHRISLSTQKYRCLFRAKAWGRSQLMPHWNIRAEMAWLPSRFAHLSRNTSKATRNTNHLWPLRSVRSESDYARAKRLPFAWGFKEFPRIVSWRAQHSRTSPPSFSGLTPNLRTTTTLFQ